jgi:hypothetical protein
VDMKRAREPRKAPRIDIGAPGIPGGQAMDVTTVPPEYCAHSASWHSR